MNNRVIIFRSLVIMLLLLGCGQAVQQAATSTGDDSIPLPTDPVYVEDGVTGGTYSSSDGDFTAVIPAGSIYTGLSANPSVTKVTLDAGNVLAEGETSVSSAYELDLQSVDNFVTTNTSEVTITFDPAGIPADKLNAQYVYVKAYDPATGTSLPIMGTISGSDLTLNLKGLTKTTVYSVVYNPNIRRVLADPGYTLSVRAAATSPAPWPTNRWAAVYSTSEATLRATIGGILGVASNALTSAQMDAVIKTRVANNATAAGAIFQTAGFRAPNLELVRSAARTGTTETVYVVYVNDAHGSSAPQGATTEAIAKLGFSYGTLYLNSQDVDDTPALALGSVLDALAHEMFHTIQFGYDIGYSNTSKGYEESTAAAYGATIDKLSTNKPQVRLAESPHKLSSFLGNEAKAYENQDFFVYVGRAYNSNSLAYLTDVYARLKIDVDSLVSAGTQSARVAPPRQTLRQSLNTAFTSKFGQGLPAIYFDFAKQRAMEHSTASQLRTGEVTAAKTLFSDLFHANAINRKTVDPQDILSTPVEQTFTNVAPFSSRVFVITPSRTVADVTAGLTITSTTGALGTTLKAELYRATDDGVELTIPRNLVDYAKNTGDILTVLVSNTGYANNMNITCKIGPPIGNTFEASVVIGGTNYAFAPRFIGGGFGSFTGSVNRTNLPGVSVSEGTPATILSNDIMVILTDPLTISASGGAYALNEVDRVFEQGLGQASLTYNTPDITNADDGRQVVFESTGGTITFTSYGTSLGKYLSGTFEATVVGSRETSSDPDESNIVGLTGTISGRFGVTLGVTTETY